LYFVLNLLKYIYVLWIKRGLMLPEAKLNFRLLKCDTNLILLKYISRKRLKFHKRWLNSH
jgi:hypothetical protein